MKRISALCGFTLLVIVSAASAATINVPDDFPAIQLAIQNASDGDVILVQPGTYVENINFLGKNITVTGTDPYDIETIEDTMIDGSGDGSVVVFENGETNAAMLRGVTITNGFGTMNVDMFGEGLFWGAGIYIYNSSPTITRNLIIANEGPLEIGDNTAQIVCYGGGIGGILSSAVISDNIIRNNTCYAGAGLMTYMGDPVIKNNYIHDNSAYIAGGVVLFGGRLLNNTIADNNLDVAQAYGEDGMAGNVYVASDVDLPEFQVTGNIIAGAQTGGGILYMGLEGGQISHNDVWGNSPGNYYGVDPGTGQETFDGPADLTGQAGNISADPCFANNYARDYHILSNSPCISAGDRNYQAEPGETDFDGNPRVYGLIVDIGADEYIGYIKPVADAGPDQHLLTPQEVSLDGSRSYFYDPCDDTEYAWEQLDGPVVELTDPETAGPSFEATEEGLYRFELTVADGQALSRPDDVVVLIGNEAPVAEAGPNQVVNVPTVVQLDGTGSHDPDPIDQLQYTWTQVGGPDVNLVAGDTARPSFYCDAPGAYAFELVVSDPFVSSAPSRVEVKTVAVSVDDELFDVGLTTNSYQHYPALSGDTVVCAMGDFWDSQWDITVKNLSSGQTDTIFSAGIDTQPDIDGQTVVWAGGATVPYTGYQGPVNLSVLAYDIASKQKITLAQRTNLQAYAHPAVSGSKVVWLEFPYADVSDEALWGESIYNVVAADISDPANPRHFMISEEAGERDPYNYNMSVYDWQGVVDISGDIVVWEGYGDIFGADISDVNNIRYFTICNDDSMQLSPVISGNIVAWVDQRNDSGDIYAADISDINDIHVFPVVTDPGPQSHPAIDGNMIVYVQGNDYGGTIMVSALTRDTTPIAVPLTNYSYGACPTISGNSIIWQDSGYGYLHGLNVNFAYSPADGPVHNITSGRNYDFIQHAINQADNGDVIVVDPGLYRENIKLRQAPVTVRSVDPNDPDVVASTVVRGQSNAAVFYFDSVDSAACTIEGLTITNGSAGIYATASNPTLLNCRIVNNAGPGVMLEKESQPAVNMCLIADNDGAGFNMPGETGGRFAKYNQPVITNCVIAGNAGDGLFDSSPTVTNCTIVFNGLCGVNCPRPDMKNSIVYNNGWAGGTAQIALHYGTVTYCDVMGGSEGVGNVDYDPLFVDPCNGDFHLMSRTGRWDGASNSWVTDEQSSSCIDAGDPNSAVGDEPDPNGGTVNLGAYGATARASMSPEYFPRTDPAYSDWVRYGRPRCWCYKTQCHGDTDGKIEGSVITGYKRVYIKDLDLLIAAWGVLEPPSGPGIESIENGICADFDHLSESSVPCGCEKRVWIGDLNELISNWNVLEPPRGPGVPKDCPGEIDPDAQ